MTRYEFLVGVYLAGLADLVTFILVMVVMRFLK